MLSFEFAVIFFFMHNWTINDKYTKQNNQTKKHTMGITIVNGIFQFYICGSHQISHTIFQDMNTNQLPSSANFVHYTSYIYILMHNRSNANRSNLIIILLGNFPNQNFCHITPLSTGPKLYIRLHCPMMTSLAVHQMKFLSQKQSPMELLII